MEFKLNLDQFSECSPIPMPVRIRLALNKLGMKFVDDGKPSAIINEHPVPVGMITCWEDFDKPNTRFYKQELGATLCI